MLKALLSDNNLINWLTGCYFVQWQKIHRIFNRTPYKTLFGVDFQTGLFYSNFPRGVVATVTTDENLEKVSDLEPQQFFNLTETLDNNIK